MLLKISGGGYNVSLYELHEGLFTYEIQPPINILDSAAFATQLGKEIEYQAQHGMITNEPLDVTLTGNRFTHATHRATHGRAELAGSGVNSEYASHIVGHALMYLLAPYPRRTPTHD